MKQKVIETIVRKETFKFLRTCKHMKFYGMVALRYVSPSNGGRIPIVAAEVYNRSYK